MAVRRQPDHMITQRRVEEEKRRGFDEVVHKERSERLVANWENTSDKKIGLRRKLEMVDRVQAMHAQTLEQRRERLSILLAAEQEEYERAIEGMVETQEQRKQRMAGKALELRNQREERRKQFAQHQLDRAFQASCDVLREALSRNVTLQVAADRAQQIELNAQRKRKQAEEERFFDELWEAERLKKVQRAQEDMERVKKMNAQLRENLARQLECYHDAKRVEKQTQADEDALYTEEVQLQLEMDARREREKRRERVELGKQNYQFNIQLRKQKDEEAKREKAEDMRLLNELISKLREEEEADTTNKRRMRKEAKEYMEALRQQMGQDAENEAELERLWAVENEKEWAKREARWKYEQDIRDNLLREVFEERALQLELKRRNMENIKRQQAEDRDRMLEEMEALTQIEKERNNQRRVMSIQQREELKKQMDTKEEERRNADRDKLLEREAAKLADQQFLECVRRQVDVVESKKPAQYRHIRASRNVV